MSDERFRVVPDDLALRANRADWDRYADDYQREHGDFLGDTDFLWCPEGLREADARLLGPVAGALAVEIGCGAAQCARWLREQGARVVGIDLSLRQLQHARRIDEESGVAVPAACASATALPIAPAVADVAFSAFGAFPFIVDLDVALAEAHRVLRPGGRLVFSVVHPVRRMFADDPSRAGLVVVRSYFDRRSYVESDADGAVTYVEPHHTIEDWITAVLRAGFQLSGVLEPLWPDGHERVWGGWGPVRGALVPGALIVSAVKPLPAPAV